MKSLFYTTLKHLHSGLRWILLIALLAATCISFYTMIRKNGLSKTGKMLANITVKTAHLQLLVGLVLYFISPKVVFSAESMKSPILRFFLAEHLAAMTIAVVLITIGYSRMKTVWPMQASSPRLFWFFLISLIMVLTLIPWPFLNYGGSWI